MNHGCRFSSPNEEGLTPGFSKFLPEKIKNWRFENIFRVIRGRNKLYKYKPQITLRSNDFTFNKRPVA